MNRRTARAGSAIVLGVPFLFLAAGCGGADSGAARAAESAEADSAPTLVEIMRTLEVDMERVAHGIWVADFDSIAAGARAVADHPKVGPEERAWILGVLGERGAGFRAADMAVHNAAVALAEAAGSADNVSDVLDAFTRLEGGCVACHNGYRPAIQAARNEPAGTRTP